MTNEFHIFSIMPPAENGFMSAHLVFFDDEQNTANEVRLLVTDIGNDYTLFAKMSAGRYNCKQAGAVKNVLG
jgi:hypothetical protein